MKKLLAILLTMLVLATAPVYASSVTDTLEEGETKTYTLGGQVFEVENIIVTDVYPYKTAFRINGEVTKTLGEGDYINIKGTTLYIKTIQPNSPGDVTSDTATVSITVPEPTPPEEEEQEEPEEEPIETTTPVAITTTIRTTRPTTVGDDLSDYPWMFIRGFELNAIGVVGDKAPSSDILALTDLMQGLQVTLVSNDGGSRAIQVQIGTAKLASEIRDIYSQNLISVGNPCNNAITNKLEGRPANCRKGLEPGQGVIKLYNRNGYYQLVVSGYDNEGVRKAARVLANWDDYNLRGTEMLVTGTLNNPRVSAYYEAVEPEAAGVGVAVEILAAEPEEEVLPTPTCTDGIKNDGEEGVDCGGPCRPCSPTKETCNGCIYDSACLPYGTRLPEVEGIPSYCSIYKDFSAQKADGAMCQNNYECSSNSCSSGKCVDLAEELRKTQQEARETRGLVEKILGWLSRWFS